MSKAEPGTEQALVSASIAKTEMHFLTGSSAEDVIKGYRERADYLGQNPAWVPHRVELLRESADQLEADVAEVRRNPPPAIVAREAPAVDTSQVTLG